ncbi:MAG: hypothetical protein WAM14_27495 [Candidatus Nitrosopolaris sp.]
MSNSTTSGNTTPNYLSTTIRVQNEMAYFAIIDRPTIDVAKNILCGSIKADGVISGFKMIKEK